METYYRELYHRGEFHELFRGVLFMRFFSKVLCVRLFVGFVPCLFV